MISTGGASAPGTGGARASTGGVSGTGGASGTTTECQKYIDEYDAEMQKARMCKPNDKGDNKDEGGGNSCAALVPAKLAGCGSNCTTYVDKPKMLEEIQKKWTMAGCTAPACAVGVCLNPRSATCSAAGVCTEGLL